MIWLWAGLIACSFVSSLNRRVTVTLNQGKSIASKTIGQSNGVIWFRSEMRQNSSAAPVRQWYFRMKTGDADAYISLFSPFRFYKEDAKISGVSAIEVHIPHWLLFVGGCLLGLGVLSVKKWIVASRTGRVSRMISDGKA